MLHLFRPKESARHSPDFMNSTCIIGIAGYSGSGKTTLIRKILTELRKQGFSVGVLKHIHHKLHIDTRGKDTDHFYRAGAEYVFAHDAKQGFARYRNSDRTFPDLIKSIPASLDLIILEGHKDIDIPGIWLEKEEKEGKTGSPISRNRKVVFRNDPQYLDQVLAYMHASMEEFHSQRPVKAGLLIGGKSTRMGAPKALLKIRGRTLAARSCTILSSFSEKTILLGSGQIPLSLRSSDRLPDVAGVEGPIAGMLSAFRWAPESTWIISSVDMPLMHKEAWEWLLSQRKPGVWAVLPKIKGSKGAETTGAVYEPMIFEHAEALAGNGSASLQDLAAHPKVITPLIPQSLARAWTNVNTPEEWKAILSSLR